MGITEKPWGYEEILEKNKHYVIKRIVVYAGKRLSKQYHEVKTETIIPMNGVGHIWINGKEVNVMKGNPITVNPKVIHRIGGNLCGDESAIFLEVSTPELEDVVRIEDDWGRVK